MSKTVGITRVRDTDFVTRAEDGNLYIEGYFVVFGSEYEMWDRAVEVIDPSAFDNALDGDIRALVNHDATLVLGRTLSNTLRLNVDNIGLYGSITINANDQDAMNLYERVKRRDVTQCSFGFDILDQQILERPDGITVFNVRKVKLYEVSICTFPAYENTNVEARKKDYEAQKNKELKEWRSKMKCKIKK